MLTRYSGAVALGSIVTFGLLMLMRAVIANPDAKVEDQSQTHVIELVKVQEDHEVIVEQKLPEPPPPPDEPPPDLPPPSADTDVSVGIPVGQVQINTKVDIGGAGGFDSDGDYLPIIKVSPIYPRRALERGQEGYVKLSFTVTATGSVRDPIVIESVPPKIFDRSAIQAALKFKYKPKMVNGEPIEVAGVMNVIRFEIQDE